MVNKLVELKLCSEKYICFWGHTDSSVNFVSVFSGHVLVCSVWGYCFCIYKIRIIHETVGQDTLNSVCKADSTVPSILNVLQKQHLAIIIIFSIILASESGGGHDAVDDESHRMKMAI